MRIIQDCRYTKRNGVFPVALAAALQGFGLDVSFHSQPDPSPHRTELAAYRRAAQLGAYMCEPLELEELQQLHDEGRFVIVSFDSWDCEGHIAPIRAFTPTTIEFVDDWEPDLTRDEFLKRWDAPGILRQCVVVWGRDDAASG